MTTRELHAWEPARRLPTITRASRGTARAWLAAALAMTMCAAVAVAAVPSSATRPFPGEGRAYLDCRCLANGQRYRIGERICLDGRIVECGRVLNNTAWLRTTERCAPAA